MKAGVVGCGYWGANHVRVLNQHEDISLEIVCDGNPDSLERVRGLYPAVRTTGDFRQLLDSDVEAVVISTPVDTHYRLAKDALLAGKHVLVEKPMSTSVQACQELIELADSRRLTLMTGHTLLYHPAVEFLKELLQAGHLGDLYYADSARLNLGVFRSDVNVLWDLAPHDISILLYLLNVGPDWVNAHATAHINPTHFETAYVDMGFPGEVLGHVHVSWLDPCKVRRLTLVGSKRMVVFDDASPAEQLRIYDKGVSVSANGNGSNGEVQYRHGEVLMPFISSEEPLKRQATDFIRSVSNGSRPVSDGSLALQVVSILEAADKSLSNGAGEKALVSANGVVPTNGVVAPAVQVSGG